MVFVVPKRLRRAPEIGESSCQLKSSNDSRLGVCQCHAHVAIELVVRHGRCAAAAVQTLPVHDRGAVDAYAGIGRIVMKAP